MLSLDLGKLSVRLTANGTQFIRTMDRAQEKMFTASHAISAAGMKMSLALTLPLALIGRKAVKSFSAMEDAIIEVQKVTDELTARKLSVEIDKMAESMPIAAVELANLSASAARFGVRGIENIRDFTIVVSKMSIATDLSAEQAGESMARIAAMASVPIKDMDKLGSAINELSNNFATSSSEIVNSMLRSSATMKEFGLSTPDMVGLSAAVNAVSESAERAGTRLTAMMMAFTDPSLVERISKAIGVTVDQFRKMQAETPLALIKQLSEVMAGGGDAAFRLAGAIDRTTRKALTALGTDSEGLTKALKLANKAFEEGTSLQKEYDAASKTLSARTTILWNRVTKVAQVIGEKLVPYIEWVSQAIQSGLKWWNSLSDRMQTVIVALGVFLTLLGPALLIIGKIIALGAFFVGLMSSLVTFIPLMIGATAAVFAFGIVMDTTKKSIKGIADALLDGNIALAAKIMWASINLEFAIGISAIDSALGLVFDLFQEIWKGMGLIALQVGAAISKGFWNRMKEIVGALTWVAEKAVDTLNAIEGPTARVLKAYDMIRKTREGVEKKADSNQRFFQDQIRNQMREPAPGRRLAQENLEIATERWTDLIHQASENVKKTVEKPTAQMEKVDQSIIDTEEKMVQIGELGDVTQALGGFRVGQLAAVGGGGSGEDKAQTTREDSLRVQEEMLVALRSRGVEGEGVEEGTIQVG